MTPLNDPTQTPWALESRALSPVGVGDTVERELRAVRSTRGTWHDALLRALRCRNQSARPDRCSWYTWEGLWHSSGANATGGPATTSKERTTSALQPQRTGLINNLKELGSGFPRTFQKKYIPSSSCMSSNTCALLMFPSAPVPMVLPPH